MSETAQGAGTVTTADELVPCSPWRDRFSAAVPVPALGTPRPALSRPTPPHRSHTRFRLQGSAG